MDRKSFPHKSEGNNGMPNQRQENESILGFADFRYDKTFLPSQEASNAEPTTSFNQENADQAVPVMPSTTQQFYQPSTVPSNYYDQIYKSPEIIQQPSSSQPIYQGSVLPQSYPYGTNFSYDAGSNLQSESSASNTSDVLVMPASTNQTQSPAYSPSMMRSQQQYQDQFYPSHYRQASDAVSSSSRLENTGQLYRQFQFPPPVDGKNNATPPASPLLQSMNDDSSSRAQAQDLSFDALNIHTGSDDPIYGFPAHQRSPMRGPPGRGAQWRRRTGSKQSLEDIIMHTIIPTITSKEENAVRNQRTMTVGLLTAVAGDDFPSPSDDMNIHGSAPIYPLTLTAPPFSLTTPINSSTSRPDTQNRPKKKSKYTQEQDALILEMKKDGKSWSEISQAAQCGNALAARNRYQVLIGQQGGRAVIWEQEDVVTLKEFLEEGEREKWEFIASELSRTRNVTVTGEDCRQEIKRLFDRDPTFFGITVDLGADSSTVELERLMEAATTDLNHI